MNVFLMLLTKQECYLRKKTMKIRQMSVIITGKAEALDQEWFLDISLTGEP